MQGAVAQQGERFNGIEEVRSSILLSSTITSLSWCPVTLLNDIQSKLNPTKIGKLLTPKSFGEISKLVLETSQRGKSISIAGSMHSMGGQQFSSNDFCVSTRGFSQIDRIGDDFNQVRVQSGVVWPQLVQRLKSNQDDSHRPMTIIQKQTGADDLTIGGAISSNIHGRVLNRKPIVDDVNGFSITTFDGVRKYCSRSENSDLFSNVIGGYGLFGFVDSVDLKLTERVKLIRKVSEISLDEVIPCLEKSVEDGATYGDFQYMTDEGSNDFLSKGIMSVYSPVENQTPISKSQIGLTPDDWKRLFVLAHIDKKQAYIDYKNHYEVTNGQIYWSDEHQFSPYIPEATDLLNHQMSWGNYRSLVLTELYVPRNAFVEFMTQAREKLLSLDANVVYGTVRLIQNEQETFLNWAKEDYVCVIFNLLVDHSDEGISTAKDQFRALIDCALEEEGSYYLTYHKWARKDQVEKAYPEFKEFLQNKILFDPHEVFVSDWYKHYKRMFF